MSNGPSQLETMINHKNLNWLLEPLKRLDVQEVRRTFVLKSPIHGSGNENLVTRRKLLIILSDLRNYMPLNEDVLNEDVLDFV